MAVAMQTWYQPWCTSWGIVPDCNMKVTSSTWWGNNLLVANGEKAEPYIGEDTASGLISLFGLSKNAKEEVSVSHWRYGEKLPAQDGSVFSIHHRTRLFDSQHRELETDCPYVNPDVNGLPVTVCPEPVYKVQKGQSVLLEFTYENAGKTSPIPVTANYYLSADNIIDENDDLLKSNSYSIERDNKPSTFNTNITLPKRVISGNHYWLGCIVKPANVTLKESNLMNNATYVGIKVVE